MFTGLIAHLGIVAQSLPDRGGNRLTLECADLARASAPGDSIAVNGVCLTVASVSGGRLEFDVVPETLQRSDLGALVPGDAVNLEPSLRLGDALGGHLVYGHVDATTRIEAKQAEGPGYRLWFAVPPGLEAMVVEKGFVALDGVSLTVAERTGSRFAVALVPETLARTTFGRKSAGGPVNLEVDPIARYVAALLAERK